MFAKNSNQDSVSSSSSSNWIQNAVLDSEVSDNSDKISSRYRRFDHVSVTSNVVERLFSRAKIIMNPYRKHMDPFHLELLLFLRYNKEYWDAEDIERLMTRSTNSSISANDGDADEASEYEE